MGLQVQRKATTAGEKLTFKFEGKGNKFIVKNFTEGDIYVGTEEGMENTVKLPSLFFQVVEISKDLMENKTETDTLYVMPEKESEKGVEVQML